MKWKDNVPVRIAIPGSVCGCLAVHKRLGDDKFTISHVETGFNLDAVIPLDLEEEQAKSIAVALQEEIPALDGRLKEAFELLPSRGETGRMIKNVIARRFPS